jgi:3-deoxy-7-phosphoheptulonate synthase
MHGNTTSSSNGVKTRSFDSIIDEIESSFHVHKVHGSSLNGLHLEMTGDKVTECIGGGMELSHDDLSINYQTVCDPRLNYEQALEVAFVVSKLCQS